MRSSFKAKLEREGLAPRTVSFYVETVHAVLRILEEGGRSTSPTEIDHDDVRYLLDFFIANDFAMQTRKGYISALRKYCRTYGSPLVSSWPKARLPPDTRPCVDWLTPDQSRTLLSYPELTPLQKLVVHMELCLGLRHVEVIRVMIMDIDDSERIIRIRGKGPAGGKPRIVPFSYKTGEVLDEWIQTRTDLVRKCMERSEHTTIPDNLIVWYKAGKLHAYSEEGYGLDKMVSLPLSDKLGFHFSNHTLRRTFGRELYRNGIPVATIAKILGHESTEVTLKYIGIDLDDMRNAMSRVVW